MPAIPAEAEQNALNFRSFRMCRALLLPLGHPFSLSRHGPPIVPRVLQLARPARSAQSGRPPATGPGSGHLTLPGVGNPTKTTVGTELTKILDFDTEHRKQRTLHLVAAKPVLSSSLQGHLRAPLGEHCLGGREGALSMGASQDPHARDPGLAHLCPPHGAHGHPEILESFRTTQNSSDQFRTVQNSSEHTFALRL